MGLESQALDRPDAAIGAVQDEIRKLALGEAKGSARRREVVATPFGQCFVEPAVWSCRADPMTRQGNGGISFRGRDRLPVERGGVILGHRSSDTTDAYFAHRAG